MEGGIGARKARLNSGTTSGNRQSTHMKRLVLPRVLGNRTVNHNEPLRFSFSNGHIDIRGRKGTKDEKLGNIVIPIGAT